MSSTATAATNPSTFPCFSNLPPELRNQIWNESLLEKDRPALFPYRNGCWSPIYLTESDKGYIANTDNILLEFCDALLEPMPIDVPVYFVNREARGAALSWAQRQGARIHFCEERQRHVFARLFDNEQDTLYVALNNFADFFVEPYNRMAEPDLFGRIVGSGPSLRHIAVPEALLQRMPGALEEIFEWFRGIEVIFIIVNAHHDMEEPQRWEIESTNGKTLFYDQKNSCFNWDGGENICAEAIYGRVEEATNGSAWLLLRAVAILYTTELGGSLPANDKHAVSVYLPYWRDTEAWARRDPQFLAQLKAGYPRFFVPLVVQELAKRLLEWAVSKWICDSTQKSTAQLSGPEQLVLLFPNEGSAEACHRYLEAQHTNREPLLFSTLLGRNLFAVVYPQQLASEGKAFWQHTGDGISSRCATFWLENAPFLHGALHKHCNTADMPLEDAERASVAIRNHIGRLLSSTTNTIGLEAVYLYPSGMSAISHTAATLSSLRSDSHRRSQVVIFGFLYVDTFKVLSKIHGFDCKLYAYSTPPDLDLLESDLKGGLQVDALYTEFPGNPLLASVDLSRLYRLSKQFGFFFVADDTVATSVNVSLLSSCDVVCTSLTKIFSGGCNVMGGSVVVNPQSRLYRPVQKILAEQFVDTYWPQDVLVMEKNSADFESRVITASSNAEHIVNMLRSHHAAAEVFYPKGSLTENIYDQYRQKSRGYGYLLSVRFTEPDAAIAFHDALNVAKGPSLGTNFTLCCPYTLLAHSSELEWAAKFGVVEHLVRISVGIESLKGLISLVQIALDVAAESLIK